MISDSVNFIKNKLLNFEPEIGIVLGSGLGELADEVNGITIDESGELPDFPAPTVEGHKGRLVLGEFEGKNVLFMQGRVHYYEGLSLDKVTMPVKVFKLLGVKTVILTNAAGAVNKRFNPADLMLITDHINFMGVNPLVGKNNDKLGTRFPDMSEIYKKNLRDLAKKCAADLGIKLREGVYLATSGPSYETPAEINMFRLMGADAVGMSTVPEAIVANYCGMNVMGISCITNYAAGVSDKKLSHSEVIENADIAKKDFKNLIRKIVKNL
ncbi:purine-nucleoside phosphorylase [bacterium]|nr:purine-nucleoside phosphorylase [bacterium]